MPAQTLAAQEDPMMTEKINAIMPAPSKRSKRSTFLCAFNLPLPLSVVIVLFLEPRIAYKLARNDTLVDF